jgi:hypothetical protein
VIASWANAAVGLRCVDAATGLPILEGLAALAWPAHDPRRVTRAVVGRNGLLSWHNLPGLGGWERTDAETEDPWASRPAIPYVLHVEDARRRYHPLRDVVTLPLDRGEAPEHGLFPTPAAAVPDGYAAVRARLEDETSLPAAWAVVDVVAGTGPGATTGRGVTGPDGQVLVLVPWPEPAPGLPPHQQSWPLQVSVRFGGLTPDPRDRSAPPSLAELLAQPAAALFTDRARTNPLTPDPIRAGRDAVLYGAENPDDLVFVRIP